MHVSKKEKLIFILGFGRSGTTWLSDIISKALGGLILFEPMHPQVMDDALDFCYYDGIDPEKNKLLKQHFDRMLEGSISHRWLIRNHLPSPMEGPSHWYVQQLLDNCTVIGFKMIRGNFLIDFLKTHYPNAKILYINRHPMAVMASIKKRTRFWEEFGIDKHTEKFGEIVQRSKYLDQNQKDDYSKLISNQESILGKSACLWKYTDLICKNNMEAYGFAPVSYEELYFKPYKTLKTILQSLSEEEDKIHPSYIFTPSMLTLKTQHSFIKNADNMKSTYQEMFYDNILEEEEKALIESILESK